MKTVFIFCLTLLGNLHLFSQAWTAEQLEEANTGKDYEYLTADEREMVQYINLCRLYPKQFATNEVKNYKGVPGIKYKGLTKYKASLIKELNSRKPCDALEFDENMYDDAECYATEISVNKRTLHQRIDCEKRKYAENLYFGNTNGKTMALEWLVDCGIATLGHRKNCLNKLYGGVGVKMETHFQYGKCGVAEFGE